MNGSAPPDWKELDHGRRTKHETYERARAWIIVHHAGARPQGVARVILFELNGVVVGYAWPVANSAGWWTAMRVPVTDLSKWPKVSRPWG